MKAVVFEKYGPPDVLAMKEIEKPVPKGNEVLIKIHASSITAADWRMRKPEPFMVRMMTGLFKPKKFNILGIELSGVVEEIGNEVTLFNPGDEIFGTTGFTFGAYAEYVCLPEKRPDSEEGSITHKPSNLNFGEAAIVPVGLDTALFFLRNQGNIQSGQKILIYGASSSVGSYAVQLAKHYGAEVTAVCSTSNLDWVKDLGADKMIDYKTTDFTQSSETYDLIFDAVGKLSLSGSMKALKEEGIFLDAVHMLRRSVQAKFATRGSKKKILGDSAKGTLEDLIYIKELVEAGKIKPVIDRTYALEEIVEATRYVETGRKKGNVIISIDHQ
ncbi:MAG: NAD(P)-dependent alcohol dehydrogenase [Candidatus Thorarchaeota archaeon]